MTDIREELRAMPSSLNDACRTMEVAANQIDALVKALRDLDLLLDFGDEEVDAIWTFDDTSSIQEAFNHAKGVLDLVSGAGGKDNG